VCPAPARGGRRLYVDAYFAKRLCSHLDHGDIVLVDALLVHALPNLAGRVHRLLAHHAVAPHIAFERHILKPVFHLIRARVETTWVPGAFQLWVRGSQRAPGPHHGLLHGGEVLQRRQQAVHAA
jgi:hypothetical protein